MHQHCMLDRSLFLRKKLSKKAFYLFGLVVLSLVTAFSSLFKVILFDVLVPLRLPGRAAFANCELSFLPARKKNFIPSAQRA